jgi:hypothetical protein
VTTVVPTATQFGQRQGYRPEQIGVHVDQQDNQANIRLALFIAFADMFPVEEGKPYSEQQQTGSERDKMLGIEEVEHATGKSEHRKSADATRTPRVGAREEILECQA